jgi:regulator of protease activity HflC (stomatin/prohibitin superfamily)
MIGVSHVTLSEWEVGLLYADGKFVQTLGPGRHRLVGRPWSAVKSVVKVDTRRQQLTVQGQEVLSADGFAVRLNATCDWRVADARTAIHATQNYLGALYNAVQLALRLAVQSRAIDQLLTDRAGIGMEVRESLLAETDALGLEVLSVALKDIVLPGELKKLLVREAEVVREGRAALAAAREETAAARARANTAKLLAESPGLLRLRELETIEKAASSGSTVVVTLPTEPTPVLTLGPSLTEGGRKRV